VLFGCPARQHWARPDSPWWIVSSARRWISGEHLPVLPSSPRKEIMMPLPR